MDKCVLRDHSVSILLLSPSKTFYAAAAAAIIVVAAAVVLMVNATAIVTETVTIWFTLGRSHYSSFHQRHKWIVAARKRCEWTSPSHRHPLTWQQQQQEQQQQKQQENS